MKRAIYIAVLIATASVYLAMLLWSLPKLTEIAGGLAMFDLRPTGYSLVEARGVITALGNTGIGFYLGPQHVLDTAYPILMALALALSFARLFKGWVATAFIALSALAGLFDLAENLAVSAMLNAGADALTAQMVNTANVLTLLKSGAVSLAMTGIIAGLFRMAWRRYSGKASRQFSTSSSAS